MTTVREHILDALGTSITWIPGTSRLYKNTRHTKQYRVDDIKMKNIHVDSSLFLDGKPGHLSSTTGDPLAVRLHEHLTRNGIEPYGAVLIFEDEVMFQVRTLRAN